MISEGGHCTCVSKAAEAELLVVSVGVHLLRGSTLLTQSYNPAKKHSCQSLSGLLGLVLTRLKLPAGVVTHN